MPIHIIGNIDILVFNSVRFPSSTYLIPSNKLIFLVSIMAKVMGASNSGSYTFMPISLLVLLYYDVPGT